MNSPEVHQENTLSFIQSVNDSPEDGLRKAIPGLVEEIKEKNLRQFTLDLFQIELPIDLDSENYFEVVEIARKFRYPPQCIAIVDSLLELVKQTK